MSDVSCPNRALCDRLADRAQDFDSGPWLVVGHRQGNRWANTAAYILVQWSSVKVSSRLADLLDMLIERGDVAADVWLEESAKHACLHSVKSGRKIGHLNGVLPGNASSEADPEYGLASMKELVEFLDLVPFSRTEAGVGLFQHEFVREESGNESERSFVSERRARRTDHRQRGLRRERPVLEEV